mgnify:CR=1 FL=1
MQQEGDLSVHVQGVKCCHTRLLEEFTDFIELLPAGREEMSNMELKIKEGYQQGSEDVLQLTKNVPRKFSVVVESEPTFVHVYREADITFISCQSSSCQHNYQARHGRPVAWMTSQREKCAHM